ncbi:hypothetical protein RFI_21134 [Reticulomyxa filosa]|uniref:Uncharacterized protein n=1 Tax=Reticulomyxa filosa TaxID=46433 RepID=X6MQE2_RETFI|nr:hypothetical protein RFI_21134 [Reticulomyxa filosa]|eukprot:ETO16223.1 hypothetical protein RFI_21134 [Reticulomyxa filosa]
MTMTMATMVMIMMLTMTTTTTTTTMKMMRMRIRMKEKKERNQKKFRKQLFNKKKFNIDFLKWLPEKTSRTCPLTGILASPKKSNYRNKDELSIGHDYNKQIAVGFQMGRYCEGRTVIEVDYSQLQLAT